MDTRKYIDSLFSDYEETSALIDFKEELKSFLDERIKALVKSGMDEKDAFEKATNELGDMSAVADEISRKKKQEILAEMYMKTRHYMPIWRIVLYILCGTVFGFGVIVAALRDFSPTLMRLWVRCSFSELFRYSAFCFSNAGNGSA